MTPRLETDLFVRIREHARAFASPQAFPSVRTRNNRPMRRTAVHAVIAALVVVGVIAATLALWKLKLLLALLFLAFTIAAAMRPGIETLKKRGIPRGVGILVHYAALVAALGLILWAVVPRAVNQVQEAIGSSEDETGLKGEVLGWLDRRLERLPEPEVLVDPALEVTLIGVEIALGILFTFAAAAYWIFERDDAVRVVTSLIPRARREVVRSTWDLIDLKLGAYVRGQLLLIVLVATVLSICFWAIGLPFWLLIGIFAGIVEIVPVIGPFTAGALAVGVGLTESVGVAIAAGLVVLVVRLLEDYLVIPRVLGHAVGLTPLTVLVSVTAIGILFGGFAVLLAIPFAAVFATLIVVIIRPRNPAEEDVPAVLFPAKEVEEG